MTATTNPNTPDKEGWTPIHCAAKEGNLEILRLLMTSTGNPNAPGNLCASIPLKLATF